MALKKNYNLEICGKMVQFDNSYIEIVNINGTKENLNLYVCIYDSNEKTNVITNKSYNYVPNLASDSLNNFEQGYEYLKTLDEYKDAIDC